LIALAIFQPELAIPALVTGLVAIVGDDKTHLTRKPPEPEPGRRVPDRRFGEEMGRETTTARRERTTNRKRAIGITGTRAVEPGQPPTPMPHSTTDTPD
jgi:hypothetical protein